MLAATLPEAGRPAAAETTTAGPAGAGVGGAGAPAAGGGTARPPRPTRQPATYGRTVTFAARPTTPPRKGHALSARALARKA